MNQELYTRVATRISELRDEKLSCSQATLLGIAEGVKEPDSSFGARIPDINVLKRISGGFRGGIGGTYGEGTCGALSAGVIALGLLLDDDGKATIASQKLFKAFSDEFGSVSCGKIREKYGSSHCTDCCLFCGRHILDLANE